MSLSHGEKVLFENILHTLRIAAMKSMSAQLTPREARLLLKVLEKK